MNEIEKTTSVRKRRRKAEEVLRSSAWRAACDLAIEHVDTFRNGPDVDVPAVAEIFSAALGMTTEPADSLDIEDYLRLRGVGRRVSDRILDVYIVVDTLEVGPARQTPEEWVRELEALGGENERPEVWGRELEAHGGENDPPIPLCSGFRVL